MPNGFRIRQPKKKINTGTDPDAMKPRNDRSISTADRKIL